MQPCIFSVFRSLDLVFDWSISLQISGLHFLIFKECFSNFWTSFSLLTYWVEQYIIYYVSQFFSIGGPVFSTALKSLAISLMRSFSSLCPDSEPSLLIAKLICAFLVVSTSRPICLSKSELPSKVSSFSAGGWLSPACLNTFLFILEFVFTVSNFFPISSLILFMFLAWLFVKILDVGLFYCKLSMSFLKKAAYCASFKLGSSFQANFYGIFCNVLITDFICHNGNYKFY